MKLFRFVSLIQAVICRQFSFVHRQYSLLRKYVLLRKRFTSGLLCTSTPPGFLISSPGNISALETVEPSAEDGPLELSSSFSSSLLEDSATTGLSGVVVHRKAKRAATDGDAAASPGPGTSVKIKYKIK